MHHSQNRQTTVSGQVVLAIQRPNLQLAAEQQRQKEESEDD
jgi:hypothetical protein